MTHKAEKLSLLAAIVINVNIMLGTGLFINTVLLTQTAGALGALVYPLVGLLILPLILAFSGLLKHHPGGTFYEFGARITPLCGFISSWGYFIGKLASSALGIHIFVTLIQQLFLSVAGINTLMLDMLLVGVFTLLNLFNMSTGRNINYLFIVLKSIPILFVLFSALALFNVQHFTPELFLWKGVTCCAPFVLFAFAGFEASCSLSKSIKDPEKNGPKAIIISYLITLTTVTAYQLGFFGVLGAELATLNGFQASFPLFIKQVFPTQLTYQLFAQIITMTGIAVSALGASYGIMYSNMWNLYTIAAKKHTWAAHLVTQKNRHQTPFVCVLITGIIVLLYLILSGGNQVPLQQIAACAVTITYTISVISFATTCFATQSHRILAVLSLLSCALLGQFTFSNALKFGTNALLVYFTCIIVGMIMFYSTKPRTCKIS